MKKYIYMDNSASSFPKAKNVAEMMSDYIVNIGSNANRSTSEKALESMDLIYETRSLIKEIFNFNFDEELVSFNSGATFGINQILQGYLKKGDKVLISAFEHAAVTRTLNKLKEKGVETIVIKARQNSMYTEEEFENYAKMGISLAFINHVSNVSGDVFPIDKLSRVLQKYSIPLAIDASQSAGHIEIDFEKLSLSALVAPSHKGLLSAKGLGISLFSESFARKLEPLLYGGTGSFSESDEQPDFFPDKFESGTLNIPAIYGLNAALNFLKEIKISNIRKKELELMEYFTKSLNEILATKEKVFEIISLNDKLENKIGVFSLKFLDIDNHLIYESLLYDYKIQTRLGLHCARLAHDSFGTFPRGTIRFSFSYFTTKKEIDYCIKAIRELCIY